MTVVRRCGDRALLLDVDDVGGIALALRSSPLPGVIDVAALTRALLGLEPKAIDEADVVTVEIPVVYDGADLDDVCAATGLTAHEVVARHTAMTYAVAFCGFAPGFAYLEGLDRALVVPRLATPRTRVPAGSVAIADTWSAVYPRESPGGWRLLGRTDVALWDLARPSPALLAPGTRVRFRSVGP